MFARCLSALKDERVRASDVLHGSPLERSLHGDDKFSDAIRDGLERFVFRDRGEFIDKIRDALYASKICSYAQGFAQMRAASQEFGWDLNFGDIALMWRGGCIIRALFLERIKEAFTRNPQLENLLLDRYFRIKVAETQLNWRQIVATAVNFGIPVPVFSAALAYHDGYRRARLPANLLQAQRDYFGAHNYQRIDKPGTFHTDWLRERKV